jgi:hypothetical protein
MSLLDHLLDKVFGPAIRSKPSLNEIQLRKKMLEGAIASASESYNATLSLACFNLAAKEKRTIDQLFLELREVEVQEKEYVGDN